MNNSVLTVSLIGYYDETYISLRRKMLQVNQFLLNMVYIRNFNGCFHEKIEIGNTTVKLCFQNFRSTMKQEILSLMQSECVLIPINNKLQNYYRLKIYFRASKLAKITKVAMVIDLDDFDEQKFSEIKQNMMDLMSEVKFEPHVCEFIPVSVANNVNIEHDHVSDWYHGPKLFDIFKVFQESAPNETIAKHNRAILTAYGDFKYVCQTADDVSLRDQRVLMYLNYDDYLPYFDFDNYSHLDNSIVDYQKVKILHDFQDRNVTWAFSINATICITAASTQVLNGMRFKFERFYNNLVDAQLEILDEHQSDDFMKVQIHFDEPIWFETLNDCRALGSFIAFYEDHLLFFGICESIDVPYHVGITSIVADTLFAIRHNNLDLLKTSLNDSTKDELTVDDYEKFMKFAFACSEPEIIAHLLNECIRNFSCIPHQILYLNSSAGKIFKDMRPILHNVNISSVSDLITGNSTLIANMHYFIAMFDKLLLKLTDSEETNQLNADLTRMKQNLQQYSSQTLEETKKLFLLKKHYSENIFEHILDPTLSNTLIKFNFNSIAVADQTFDNIWFLKKIFETDDSYLLDYFLAFRTFSFEEYAKLLSEAKRLKCSRIIELIETNYFSLLDFKTNQNLLAKITKNNKDVFIDVNFMLKLNKTNEAQVRNALNALAVHFLCQYDKADFYEQMPKVIRFLKIYFENLLPNFGYFFETIHFRFHKLPPDFKLFCQNKYTILDSQIVCEKASKPLTLLNLLLTENLLELWNTYGMENVRVFSDIEIMNLFENQISAKPVIFYYKTFLEFIDFRKHVLSKFPLKVAFKIWDNISEEIIFLRFFQQSEKYQSILPF